MRARWEALHASLHRSLRTLQADQAFAAAKQHHPTLAPWSDPGALVSFLTGSRDEQDAKDHLLRALVRMAQGKESAQLGCAMLWLGLWPGLDAVYRRRRPCGRDADELVSELCDAFLSLIERLDLSSVRRVAATLVRSTERDLMDRRKRAWAHDALVARGDIALQEIPPVIGRAGSARFLANEAFEGAPGQPSPAPDELRAIQGWLEQVVGEDAELVLSVLLLEETQREAGLRLGMSHDAARKRFQRALRHLRDSLESEMSHSARPSRF
jgi:DNA-directed RNA polymerase specialized sigma24 family protein